MVGIVEGVRKEMLTETSLLSFLVVLVTGLRLVTRRHRARSIYRVPRLPPPVRRSLLVGRSEGKWSLALRS